MPDDLTVLADHRDALLLAEVGAWLHDMGKCADEHIVSYASDKPVGFEYKYKEAQGHRVDPSAMLTLLGEEVSIQDLIREGMPGAVGEPAKPWLVRALGRCHNAAQIEKEASGSEGKQLKDDTRLSTAFGIEGKPVVGLTRLLDGLSLAPLPPRSDLKPKLRTAFSVALGETRRPINEIDLWDWSSLVAALYKAAVAGALLGHKPEPQDLQWRLLSIRVDRLAFLSTVTRIPDLLARQQLLDDAFKRVRRLLEQELPLATRLYAGANDHVYVVPDLAGLLDMIDGDGRTLQTLLQRAFAQGTVHDDIGLALSDEVVPMLDLGLPWRAQKFSIKGGKDKLRDEVPPIRKLLRSPVTAYPDPSAVASAWSGSGREVCPVCGLRPKWEQDDTCETCRQRRQSRIDWWGNDPTTTIWLDEIADHKDTIALIVGKFDLGDWLSGDLVQTMLVKKPEAGKATKNPSLARLRRVWETTERFWTHSVKHILDDHDYAESKQLNRLRQARWSLFPNMVEGWRAGVPYDGTFEGQTISLLWQAEGQRFITISNLQTLSHVLQGQNETTQQPNWHGRKIIVSDPDDPRRMTTFAVTRAQPADGPLGRYSPHLTLLESPDQFMALVPGYDAFALLAKMKRAYEQEFGKVRNRLPLHLGLVFADARQPLRAILDAGRRMLAYRGRSADDTWRVEAVKRGEKVDQGDKGDKEVVVQLERDTEGAALTWRVPLVMGDGTTTDDWYPYVFVDTGGDDGKVADRERKFKGPRRGAAEPCWLVHAGDLQRGDEVYFTPATLDVQWLDAAAGRFEVAYDDQGRRLRRERGRTAVRPYLLDELATLKALADVLGAGLAAAQRYALRDTIEGKREDWQPQGAELACGGAFWQFCRDAIVTAEWKKGRPSNLDEWADHATRGTLTDVINLYARLDLFETLPEKEASRD